MITFLQRSFSTKSKVNQIMLTTGTASLEEVMDMEKEIIRKLAKKHKFPANVLRLFQVYGPNQGENRAVMQILKFCLNKEQFPASDGKQIRDFCFVDDVIRAIDLILKKNISGKLINIANGKGITMKKLILTIRKVAKGGEPQFGLFKSRSHENPNLVPSIDLAKRILKWRPKIKLEKGLKITKRSING